VNSTTLAKLAPLGGERLAEIGEDLRTLRLEIGRRFVGARLQSHLAGDEQKLRRLDARDVGILAERFAEAFGVDDADLRHGRLLSPSLR
jgi:hypothetical protein